MKVVRLRIVGAQGGVAYHAAEGLDLLQHVVHVGHHVLTIAHDFLHDAVGEGRGQVSDETSSQDIPYWTEGQKY